MRNTFLALAAAAALSLPLAAQAADEYTVDPVHSSLVFSIKRGGLVDVYGSLNITAGSISLNTDDLAGSSVRITVDMNSVDTNVDKRDDHVRSADFFNVAKFPTATFESTALCDNGDGSWTLTGDLTFMGITRSIEVPISMVGPETGEKGTSAGFSGSFILNTTDFGWPVGALSSEVNIIISLLANKVEPAPAAAQ